MKYKIGYTLKNSEKGKEYEIIGSKCKKLKVRISWKDIRSYTKYITKSHASALARKYGYSVFNKCDKLVQKGRLVDRKKTCKKSENPFPSDIQPIENSKDISRIISLLEILFYAIIIIGIIATYNYFFWSIQK